ncbi:GNAT family N-acetyltransferase [Maribacter sp. R77961]|uniref:GNAT family N-acetyltransferase n=1 Tax=Maribacter sp. R77961 TaxID=3093871 RepID=UPI0037C876BA
MIQHAKISQIPDILHLTEACRLHMESKAIFQWTTSYPNKAQFLTDLERKELYVLKEGNNLIGCMVISSVMDKEYQHVKWLTQLNNVYIHRLAVHPSQQGKGFAQQLMNFAEEYARTNHYLSVRLDTFSQNKRNQKFYETRGYQKLQDIYLLDQSKHPFHCYELVL